MSNCCPPSSITVPCGIGLTFQLGEIGSGSENGSENNDLNEIEKRLDELEKKQQSVSASFSLCEFYYLRNPKMPKGFEPAQGGIVERAKDFYPEAWAFLQTDEGKALCTTEDEWQAMTTAVYYIATGINDPNNASSFNEQKVEEFSFNGIGGAPFYVQNLNAGTIRLPDLRGMYSEASGFDGLTVGGVHGDMMRKIWGTQQYEAQIDGSSGLSRFTGTFYRGESTRDYKTHLGGALGRGSELTVLDSSRVVPTGNANKPRAWGANACVYLGKPTINSEG